jgi:hypothetical protein
MLNIFEHARNSIGTQCGIWHPTSPADTGGWPGQTVKSAIWQIFTRRFAGSSEVIRQVYRALPRKVSMRVSIIAIVRS